MFPDLRRLPYLRRLQHLKLWTLEERRVRPDLIKVYKIIYIISSVSFDTFLKYNNYGATSGQLLKLTKRRASTELKHHFFSERVINIRNSLDNRTVTSGFINIFKGNLERLNQSKDIDLFVGNTDATWFTVGEVLSGKLSGKKEKSPLTQGLNNRSACDK